MRVWHRDATRAGLYEAAIRRAVESVDAMSGVPACMLDDTVGSCVIIVATPADSFFDAQQQLANATARPAA